MRPLCQSGTAPAAQANGHRLFTPGLLQCLPASEANMQAQLRTRLAASLCYVSAILGVVTAAAAVAAENAADIIAAQIRTQGYVCESPQGAERVTEASKPDEPVWMLRCSNATYRVRLIPDMAAKVETVK